MKRFLTVAAAAAALWTVACQGGGGPTITPPPPTGNYTPASLKGTYAFVTSGEVITSTMTSTPFARTGSFIADGAGHITNGVYDVVNSGGFSTTPTPNPITGGTYTVNVDGRGTVTLNVNSNGTPASIEFGFVLTSGSSGTSPASDGLLIDLTSPLTPNANQASTGSGNLILQDPAALQAGISSLSGPYVFDFSGLDGTQPPNGPNPESLVGQFISNNTGAITSAVEDSNDAGTLNSGVIVAGPLTADSANMTTFGRGTTTFAGQPYIFYIVNSGRVRFISNNANGVGPMLTGDAVSQSSGLPVGPTAINGSFAFLVGGASANGGLIRVGRFTVTSGALNKILLDVNDAGNETQVPGLSSGTIASFDSTTGRGTLSFTNSTATYSFVFYLSSPSDGVIQETTGSAGAAIVVDDGTLAAQSGSPFTSSNISGNYALNWSGLETSGGSGGFTDEEDLVSLVKVSNLSLSGTSDIFQFTSTTLTPVTDIGTGGSINFNGGDGAGDDGKRVDMTVSLSGNAQIKMATYIVNPQLAFFINTNQSGAQRIVAGILKTQQ